MLKGGDGKTLLNNWQEEREVYDLDCMTVTKHGHQGLLSTNFVAKVSDVTEVRESFVSPNIRRMSSGKRNALLEKALYKKVTQELLEDKGPNYSKEFPKQSVTHEHYNTEFTPIEKKPTRPHDANKEMPFSYWTEHVTTAHGVSHVKTFDTPFRKNAKFSTPIEEAFDDPKPYEVENYPYQAQDGCN